MAGYKVTISNDNDKIEFSSENENNEATISEVNFKMSTLDNNTSNRADAVRAEFEIKGQIFKSNKEQTLKLLKWAIDNDINSCYRDVAIEVYEDAKCSGEILRRYEISSMFVIDYDESKSENNQRIDFTLFIAQRSSDNNIKVYAV